MTNRARQGQSLIQRMAEEVKILQVITVAAGAAGTSEITGTVVDLSGYQGCLFVVQFGPIVAGAVTSIKVQQDDAAAMAAAADLADTGQTVADTDDNTVRFVDVKRPSKDFLRLVVSRGTQAATCAAMAYLYAGRQFPTAHGAGVTGEVHDAPVEGTP